MPLRDLTEVTSIHASKADDFWIREVCWYMPRQHLLVSQGRIKGVSFLPAPALDPGEANHVCGENAGKGYFCMVQALPLQVKETSFVSPMVRRFWPKSLLLTGLSTWSLLRG